jgi:hypothetical protein
MVAPSPVMGRSRRLLARECFRDLPRNPLRRRATGNAYPYELPAPEPDDHESMEEGEWKSGNDKHIAMTRNMRSISR